MTVRTNAVVLSPAARLMLLTGAHSEKDMQRAILKRFGMMLPEDAEAVDRLEELEEKKRKIEKEIEEYLYGQNTLY